MAEHARHSLVRSGFAIRPRDVCTLAGWLDQWSPLAAAPAAVVDLMIERALDAQAPARFAAVAGFPGFRRALADVFRQAPSEVFPPDLAALAAEVRKSLEDRGLGLRHARLARAADALRMDSGSVPRHIVVDGFFTLSPPEIDLVRALAGRASVTITLPDWPGSQRVRTALLAGGFEEKQLSSRLRSAPRTGFSAATIEREVEEIGRRIVEYALRGRAFREMAVVLRSREPYAAILETTLARFGIPARLYFDPPAGSHPALIFFANVIRAMLAGWDHELLLRAIRMPVSGMGATPAGDELDFAWREKIPAAGLPLPAGLEQLVALDSPQRARGLPHSTSASSPRAPFCGPLSDSWRRERVDPAEWASRLRMLRALMPQPDIGERLDRDQAGRWRSTAAALEAFDAILESATIALKGSGPCPLSEFWRHVETGLALEPLRAPDARRNVVHVMDAHEARQWELPIVFVCGLVERHFPQYHREDPILGEAARIRAGLDTVAERQAEERFLFDLATSRATEQTIVSYPRFNEQGEDTLPSFFLNADLPAVAGPRIIPRVEPAAAVRSSSGDLPRLTVKTLSASGIESYLQCPFQFFARKILRLRQRPPAPRDRLDLLLQGSILHGALAEWTRVPLLGIASLDQVFEEECAQRRVPRGYRTEAVRLELVRHFRRFLESGGIPIGWPGRVEESFSYAVNPLVTITGRIDLLACGPANQALIVDYKYSAGDKIRERVDDSSEGNAVQGGLYLAAAQRAFGLEPVAMLFCGLKKDITWGGWHVSVPGLISIGTACTHDELHRLIESAEAAAVRVHEAITSGDITVRPADLRKCQWCDFRDVCRVESAALIEIGHA